MFGDIVRGNAQGGCPPPSPLPIGRNDVVVTSFGKLLRKLFGNRWGNPRGDCPHPSPLPKGRKDVVVTSFMNILRTCFVEIDWGNAHGDVHPPLLYQDVGMVWSLLRSGTCSENCSGNSFGEISGGNVHLPLLYQYVGMMWSLPRSGQCSDNCSEESSGEMRGGMFTSLSFSKQ